MKDTKQNYVAGLLFDDSRRYVWLIRKNNPEWQRGKLNAIGGKVETNEHSLMAMEREFEEETGLLVDTWESFLTLTGPDWKVRFFRAFVDYDTFMTVKQTENETPYCHQVALIPYLGTIPNVKWIVPMALDETILPVEVKDSV